jgi:hypothetical protein
MKKYKISQFRSAIGRPEVKKDIAGSGPEETHNLLSRKVLLR